LTEVIFTEGIECEFLWKGGGWDIFLTEEEFRIAKREMRLMREAGGYVESLKIFEGEAACEVTFLRCQGVNGRLLESNFARVRFIPGNELRYDLILWLLRSLIFWLNSGHYNFIQIHL
jgi:hypothetical protein